MTGTKNQIILDQIKMDQLDPNGAAKRALSREQLSALQAARNKAAWGSIERHALDVAICVHVNAPMILGTLGGVEIGLNALAIPHGKGGVQAAIDWLGESVPA